MPATSTLRSSAGPDVVWTLTCSSVAMMPARVVLPKPGGPASSTWSSVSPRLRAACTKISSCSLTLVWPTKSAKRLGRSDLSKSPSSGSSTGSAMRRVSSVIG